MAAFFSFLRQIWPSLLGMLLAALGSVLSLGVLGLVLYHLVSPALALRFPPLERWDQSLVWPLIIAAPLLWSPAFLLAGLLNLRLRRQGWGRGRRVAAYLAVLWLAGLASWWLMLELNTLAWAGR